ncbi:MAG: phosphatidate cytidylyltransferase [Ruminococcaceae bacterium]|nr:phosphatidate cytidylyltransferase [Oscillospiraceae bacterium]
MLTRTIVAVIAIPLLLAVLLFAPLWATGIVIGGIAAMSAVEFLRCSAKDTGARMQAVTAVCAFCIPFACVFYPSGRVYEIALFFLFAYSFCELMLTFRREERMGFESFAAMLIAGGVLPIMISAIVRLGLREWGTAYILLPFVVTFSCDSGAYFAGVLLGKHKLVPTLSPNKTIEGSIGGFLLAIAVMLLYGFVLTKLGYEVNLIVLAIYAFLGSVACQLGDLSFSAVKRLFGIKDFGRLIPGHGGMLDRFDSMFWTAALVELLVSWVPAITK